MTQPRELPDRSGSSPVPPRAGIGLKPEHYAGILTTRPELAFVEIHAENYMGDGGPPHRYLEAIAAGYPLSFHGVAMSLGGSDRLDADHLQRWRRLVDRYSPALVSEHVAWSGFGAAKFHDLLPVPYSDDALRALCRNIDEMQETIGRRILIENPSRYIGFVDDTMEEPDFLVEAACRSGCGLLLDVNNVYVSARNQQADMSAWLDRIPDDLVDEIHLAGHAVESIDGAHVLIDDHGSRVCEAVWSAYRQVVGRIGLRSTLIEWDTDVPPLDVLIGEARRADSEAQSVTTTANPRHAAAR